MHITPTNISKLNKGRLQFTYYKSSNLIFSSISCRVLLFYRWTNGLNSNLIFPTVWILPLALPLYTSNASPFHQFHLFFYFTLSFSPYSLPPSPLSISLSLILFLYRFFLVKSRDYLFCWRAETILNTLMDIFSCGSNSKGNTLKDSI